MYCRMVGADMACWILMKAWVGSIYLSIADYVTWKLCMRDPGNLCGQSFYESRNRITGFETFLTALPATLRKRWVFVLLDI